MERLIGVMPLWDEKKDSIWMLPGYMRGIEEAGAVPVILPLTGSEATLDRAINAVDGFLFTGGQDVNPAYYGETKSAGCGEVCGMRDWMEKYIFDKGVLKLGKPALGICRGLQFINVILGGSLYQDIPTELPSAITHSMKPPYDVHVHAVGVNPESPLHILIGKERIDVNSSHHQGIKNLARGLEAMAQADDGLVEAVCMPDYKYVWAVQWHPEMSLGDDVSRKIFASFTSFAGLSGR